MTSLDRAKTFMLRKARVIAMTSVPLASLIAISAPAANAGAVTPLTLNTAACAVTVTGGFASSGASCTTAQLTPGSNGVTGVKLFGSATATSQVLTDGIVGQIQAPGNPLTLDFKVASGTTNGGQIAGVIPISYKFSVTDTDSTTADITWQLIISANGLAVFTSPISAAFAGNGATISGTVNTIALPPTTVASYGIEFKVTDASATNGQQLAVTIPQNSIDVNALVAGTPEPGTFAMLGSALVGLGIIVRRRRKQ